MVKTVTTDAEAFAVYEAFFKAATGGNEPVLDLSDAGFYGHSGLGLTAAQLQRENIDLSALLIAGDTGVGSANPLSVEAVSQIAEALLAQINQVSGLTTQPDANFTEAELAARAAQLSSDMLAEFQAQIAANPAAATYLPSTPEEEAQLNTGVANAIQDLADARAFTLKILAGDTSPEVIGLAVAASVKTATSILAVLPLPPAAKAAVNIVKLASYLAPGIAAAAKGDGDPAALLTIAGQMAASVLTWGASDYFFDYVAPIIVSAAVNADLGSDGLIDLSPTAVSQGLIEAAVHDNGGTLPDWWYSATGSDNGSFDQTYQRAQNIAEAYGGLLNHQSYMAELSSQIRAQYSGYGQYYQELTLNLDSNLGDVRYYFAFNGQFEIRPFFSASNIILSGVDPNTTNPWDLIYVSNSPAETTGGIFVLEKDPIAFSTSDAADTVYAPAGRPVNLQAGNDSFNFAQDVLGGTGISPYYLTVTAGLVDGGTGFDTLSTAGLTDGNAAGYTGDIVIDHNTVRYVTGNSSSVDASNLRTIATHQNFEEFHTGDLRLFDMRQSGHAVKLSTENAFEGGAVAQVYGSAYGDTLILDTDRIVTANVTLWQGQVTSVDYGISASHHLTVDAGAGHDYVAGELVNGATYRGGSGIDTFEIRTPPANRATQIGVVANTSFVTSLDLETGATWMRTHAVGNSTQYWVTQPFYDVLIHTDTTATVQGFEWAVGSQHQDIIYALNSGSRIRGQAGDDTLIGRGGHDQLYGGEGNDVITGGGGVNRLEGGGGYDTITGGANRDMIRGGSGNDSITDLGGSNLISGGHGHDHITVGEAANEIHGGTGNDTILAGNGGNLLDGGAGNDVITTGSGDDTIRLGSGLDELSAGAGDDVVTDIWSPGDIVAAYNVFSEPVAYRNATLDGGTGYDVLTVDIGGSSMIYEDLATFQSGSFSYDFATGVRDTDPATGRKRTTEYLNFEEVHLTGGDITVDLVSWVDFEPDFWPSIAGHTIDNAIGTGSGNDNVALGAGNDTYFAGLGNDTIAGEEEFDTLDYSRLDAGYTVDFSGLDANGDGTIRILNGDGSLAATDTVSGFEAIVGTGHGDVISLDTGDNALRGGGGNDTLRGGAGNDRFLFGLNDGADTLADAAIGDILVFEGPDGSAAPTLVRGGSAGNYTYTVTFGSTTATFASSSLLDLNVISSSSGGITTWEMTVVDGALVARDDGGVAFGTDEDTVLTTGDVLANDTDPGMANMQIVSFDAISANGAAVTRVPGTGQFTYDPADIFDGLIDGQSATDTFTYTISDGTTTTTATVTIDIAGFTDNPVAYADSATTTEDASVIIDALANDLDPGAKDAVVSQFDATSTGGGSVVYNGDGTFTYTPGAGHNSLKAGETGTDTFTYTLDDGRYASTTTVTVTVTGVDDPFVANDDSRVLLEDQVATLNVLANDVDPDGDPLSLVSVGTPNVGTAQIVNGEIVYTPPLNYNGPVTFTYDATDGVNTKTATVSLNYVAVDDPAVVVNDAVTATIGRGPITIDATANDYDPEGGSVTIWTAHAWSVQAGPVQVIDNNIVWTPAAHIGVGTYQLYYGVEDDAGHSTGGQVTVTLIDEQAPYAVNFIVQGFEDAPITVSGTASYYDQNGDTLSVVSIQTENIANATVVDNGDGTFTATPDADFVGIVHVPVVVTDGIHEVAHTQSIEFQNTYDPITLTGDMFRVRPDDLLIVHTSELLANDVNPDGTLNGFVTSVGLGVNGTVSGFTGESQTTNYTNPSHPGLMDGPSAVLLAQAGGRFTFTPDAGFHGVATFEYNFFELAVYAYTPVNGQVTVVVDTDVAAADDTASTAEDSSVIVDVLANDSDADGDAMVVHKVDQPANGVAEVLADGTIRYTPNADFAGTETITYYVGSQYQPESAASTASITITVNPVIDPITAVDDNVTVAEDQQVVLDLTGNDRNPDGLGGAVLSVGTPAHGTIEQNGQTFTYTPDADYSGSDSFSYTREDGLGGTTTATVAVTVTAVNDAPVANADSVTVAEDGSLTFDPRSNDSDTEGTALSITGLGTPAHGSAQINPDGTVTYMPDANYYGDDSFTYVVSDGELTATATVNVSVQPGQDAPVAAGDAASTQEDTAITIDVIANDTELDGETLTVTGVTGAVNGQVQFSGGQITYTPDADFNGAEQLTYTVSDGNGGTATATVDINVTPVNDAPMVLDDTSSAVQSATQTVTPLANDSDADGQQLSITALNGTAVQPGQFVSLASGALVFLNGDGSVSFFPGGNYDHLTQNQSLAETVSYAVSDGAGGSASGSIQFTVTGINDAPIAVPDVATIPEDTALTVGVLGNDRDAEGDALSLTAVADPANGTVSFTSGGSITFTPDADFTGSETISYTISDGLGGSSTGTLTVTVTPVNDAPVAVDDAASTNEDTAVSIDVLANDSDVETANLVITGTGQGSHGAVDIVNGQLVYSPDANFNGTDSFTYNVGDGALTTTATVTVTVQPVQDAPLATPDSATTAEDTAVVIDVIANDTELDGESLTVTGVTGAVNGQVQFSGGQITYTPDADFNGAEQLTYTVSDGNGGSATATVDITVTAVNDAPVVNADSVTLAEDGSVTFDPRTNDSDPEGAGLTITSLGTPAHGAAQINADGTVTYVPDANFFGSDSFTYVVSDGTSSSAGTVQVNIAPVNDAPTGIALSNASIDENVAGGTRVGDIIVTDPDLGDAHSLRLIDNALGVFALNGTTLTLADTASLDFEAQETYQITVEATDAGNQSIVRDLAVSVNDLVETFTGADGTDDKITGDAGDNTISAGSGGDTINGGLGADIITTGAGADVVQGTVVEFYGDQIRDFMEEDTIVFIDAALTKDDLRYSASTGQVTIDADGDGKADGSFGLNGTFSGGEFMTVRDGANTILTFENYLPFLKEGVEVNPALINGVINQTYLTGNGNKTFAVENLSSLTGAGYDNVIGVYEIASDGTITDARILIANANAAGRAQITGVEDGNTLGFFIVQNGARWLSGLSETDTFEFIDAAGDVANISDGNDVTLAVNSVATSQTVFHSYASDLNVDGVQHALSGITVGGGSMVVGFEDLTGGGDRDYEDVLFRVTAEEPIL